MLVNILGQRRDGAVGHQASDPAVAGDLRGSGEQTIGHLAGSVTGAVERQDDEVEGATAESELVPVHDAGDALPVGEDVREIQVVVGEVKGREP